MGSESALSSLNFTQKLCQIEPVETSTQPILRQDFFIRLASPIECDKFKPFRLC